MHDQTTVFGMRFSILTASVGEPDPCFLGEHYSPTAWHRGVTRLSAGGWRTESIQSRRRLAVLCAGRTMTIVLLSASSGAGTGTRRRVCRAILKPNVADCSRAQVVKRWSDVSSP
jgi:hypothetical protein